MSPIIGVLPLAFAGGHAVADFGLQSPYVAEFKVRTLRRVDENGRASQVPNPDWFVTLGAHCLIHAFVVLAIAFPAVLGARLLAGDDPAHATLLAVGIGTAVGWLEFGAHFAIDDAKGREMFSYRVDQGLHYLCKFAWIIIIAIAVR